MESLMNPADLDIPDPCNSSQELSPISNDELMSQLAGKEIERLLAEVDQQLDAAMGVKPTEPSPALALRRYPRPFAPGPAIAPDQAAGLAQLAHQSQERRPEKRQQIQIFSIDPVDDQDVDETLGQESHESMEVVGTPVHMFERVAGIEANALMGETPRADYFADFETGTVAARVPAWLKPLAWINAPFEGISQGALGALGKVAIVLFVSAIATLAYVIVLTRA